MRIPIVMVMNDSYIIPTKVAIHSMRKYTDDNVYLDIIIMCSNDLNDESRKQMNMFVQRYNNIQLRFYDVKYDIFKQANTTAHIPLCSYYRLVLDEVITDSKCLFLDGDLLVLCDLRELYDLDLGDNYIAGVIDMGMNRNPDLKKDQILKYGFKLMREYINGGVLVIDVDKIRKEGLQEKFLSEIGKGYFYMDQDIINKVCQDRIYTLPWKYNKFHRYDTFQYDNKPKEKKSLEFPKIIHYAGAYKPWTFIRVRESTLWWKEAKEALGKTFFKKLYKIAKKMDNDSKWSHLAKRCLNEKEIVIVGYTCIGLDVYDSLLKLGIKSDIVFCDNSPIKQEMSVMNCQVKSVKETFLNHAAALWINTSQNFRKELNDEIRRLGVDESRIINYLNKPYLYYEFVDEKWQKREYEELIFKKTGKVNTLYI